MPTHEGRGKAPDGARKPSHHRASPHDLNVMSLPELETYLDEVLRVDEGNDVDSPESSARK